ncbi:hypothetical protein ACS0TY_000104 [Phlomoides rotata]
MKSKFLEKLFAKKLSGTTLTLTPRAIQNEIFKEYGLTINYDHARLTKGNAMSILYGDGATTFSKLPGYLYQLKLANPGSHTKLLLNDDHIFKYAFFALRGSIDGFLRFGRPVIVIDETHLKGKYCGIVFVAVTQDGNGQIFGLEKLLWARKLPVVAMLEYARVILEGWFTDRRNEAATHTQILCKTVSKKMVDIRRRASNLVVTNLGSFQYKVLDVSDFFIVDLRLKKCDCGEFQLSLMSCIHAAATIRFANLNLSDFVSPYFHAKTAQEMWGGSVKPVPHPDHWVIPEWINSTSCDPPMQPRQAGQPRQSRRPSGLESSTSTPRRSQQEFQAQTTNLELPPRGLLESVRYARKSDIRDVIVHT